MCNKFLKLEHIAHKKSSYVLRMIIYNAITQDNCFVKGSHKYDVYLRDKHKAHLNWPNKDRISIFI